MSKLPDNVTKLSDTLTLYEWTDLRNGNFGFWLWDETRGMNLSMKAKTAPAVRGQSRRWRYG